MKIIAHRGVINNAPENSMAAFLDAAKQGYGVECDVRLTKDKIPVILHDTNFKRVAGINQQLRSLKLDQVQNIQLEGQHPVPTVEAVIRHVLPDTFVNFDIKEDEAVKPLLKLLKGADANHGMLLSARGVDAVTRLHANFSEAAVVHSLAFLAAWRARKAETKTIVCRDIWLNRRMLNWLIERGYRVYFWGRLRDPAWFRKRGVSGLIKDI